LLPQSKFCYIVCKTIENKARRFIDPITEDIVGKSKTSNIVSYLIGFPRANLETNQTNGWN
jgi:hypothetical protein